MNSPSKRLFCIFAHPDDEAFGPGGTIAKLSQEKEIYIICVTDGDADEKFSKNRKDLKNIRNSELKNSAKILGIKNVFFLGFKDGSLCNNNYHEVADRITEILEKYKPSEILTFNKDGVSGHLDHVAVSMISSYLFERLSYINTIYYFCGRIEEKEKLGKDYFIYFPEGIEKQDADWVNDVGNVWDKKVRAMKAHVSQKDDCGWILENLGEKLKEEYFLVRKK